jgi:hypothetical protein
MDEKQAGLSKLFVELYPAASLADFVGQTR